jgi:hypothetical protein
MNVRTHSFEGSGVRAEVTPREGRFRVNVFGPHHPHGLLPVITDERVEEAMSHADRLALEIYPHACDREACGAWVEEGE